MLKLGTAPLAEIIFEFLLQFAGYIKAVIGLKTIFLCLATPPKTR